MRGHQKLLLSMMLSLMLFLVLPMVFAFTEVEEMGTTTVSHTRTIYPNDHRGRIQFSFEANDSLTAAITDASETTTLWIIVGTNGSCDLNVNKDLMYRAKFTKSTGYAVRVEYTVIEQGIPGFELLAVMLALVSIIGLVTLRKKKKVRRFLLEAT